MPNLTGLAALFRLRPDRAADYLAAKGFKLSGPYWEMDGPQHSHLFTVANLAKMDILHDIRGAVQQALDEGHHEKWFADQLVDVLKAKGWWGGKDGSLRRLHTIYATNLQTALMAGRHRQAMEQIDRAPWAQYMAIRDHRSRPAHAALHGHVFRIDSPAWKIISPPSGYNCRCSARYLSDRELEKRGLKPAEDIQILEREPPGKKPVNPLTGATPQRWIQRGVSVPSKTKPGERDILWADPGWDNIPGSDGAERALVDRLMAKATDLGDGVRMAVQAGINDVEQAAAVAKMRNKQAAQAKAYRTLRRIDPERDDILTAIAKSGGLSKYDAELEGVDPAEFKRRGHSIFRIFTSNGDSFDGMAENLRQYGYPVLDADGNYSPNTLLNHVMDALGGKKVYSTRNSKQMDDLLAKWESRQGQDGFDDALAGIIQEVIPTHDVTATIKRGAAWLGDDQLQDLIVTIGRVYEDASPEDFAWYLADAVDRDIENLLRFYDDLGDMND